MRSIWNISFKGKMLLYAASTTVTALVVCCVAVVAAEWNQLHQRIPRDLGIQADVLGTNATAPLTFNDHDRRFRWFRRFPLCEKPVSHPPSDRP